MGRRRKQKGYQRNITVPRNILGVRYQIYTVLIWKGSGEMMAGGASRKASPMGREKEGFAQLEEAARSIKG